MPAELIRVPMADPGDAPDIRSVLPADVAADRVRAVIVKSEGNGCVNDFSRSLASMAWGRQIPDAVTVVSGGTEGILSPHATLVADVDERPGGQGDLVVGVGTTRRLGWTELGREAQALTVADAVGKICAQLGVVGADVVFVLVKCPLLTTSRIAWAKDDGEQVSTADTYESMAVSRAASALGVGYALGEFDARRLGDGLAGDLDVWSAAASASAGAELDCCKVAVLARKPDCGGTLRATSVVMRDAIDAEPVLAAVTGIHEAGGEVCQVFAKADPDPTGQVRGRRHTMFTDSDIHSTRHARAAVGGLLAGLIGDPMIYVSGGAEHQGPPGGGPVILIWEPRDVTSQT